MKKVTFRFFLLFFSTLLSLNICLNAQETMPDNHDKIKDVSEFYLLAYDTDFKFSDCLDYYDSCILANKAKGKLNAVIEASIHKANYYRFKSNDKQAIDLLQSARELTNKDTPDELLNEIDYCYAVMDYMNGDFKKQVNKLDRIFERLAKNKNTPPKAKYFQSMGDAFIQQNEPDSALQYFLQAYSLLQSEFPEENIYYVYYLHGIGQAYNKALNIRKSMSILDSTKRLMKRLGISIKSLQAGIENTMGNNFLQLGEFTKSRSYYFSSIALYSSLNRLDAIPYIKFNIAMTYHMEDRYLEAIDYYNECLASELSSTNQQSYKTIQAIASAYAAMNNYDSAYYYHHKALEVCENIYGYNNINTMNRYSIIGAFFMDNDQADSAYNYLYKAAAYFDDHEIENRRSFHTHIRLADLHRQKEELPLAMHFLSQSMNDHNDYASPIARKNKYEFLFMQSLILFDSACRTKNNELSLKLINRAQNSLRKSIYYYEKQLNSLDLEKNKLYLSQSSKELFALMLELFHRKSKIENIAPELDSMLKYSERFKASVLLKQLNRQKELNASEGSQAIRHEKQDIRNRIKILETELGTANAGDIANREQIMRLRTLYDRYDSLSNKADKNKTQFSDLYASISDNIQQQAQNLPDETLIIEYFFYDSILNIFYVSNAGVELSRQNISNAGREILAETIHSIKAFDPSRMKTDEIKTLKNNLYYLYQKLILPDSNNEYENLIIIADDILSQLPFEALIEEQAENSNRFDMEAFLLKRYSISYAYSIHSFFAISNMKDAVNHNPEVLCLAPFASTETNKDGKSAEQLNGLQESAEELNQIRKYFPCKNIAPGISDKEKVLEALSHSDIIHFATHSVADTNEIYGSRIILSPGKAGEKDQSLNIAEIYDLDLKAGLAFINGCETGYGRYLGSDGYISIGRAFYTAGCPSVIMNIWQVDDRSSKIISSEFYRKLSEGNTTAKALQLAKLNYLEQAYGYENHPHFWSSYLHFGQAQQFENGSGRNRVLISILATLLLLSGLIYLFRKGLK